MAAGLKEVRADLPGPVPPGVGSDERDWKLKGVKPVAPEPSWSNPKPRKERKRGGLWALVSVDGRKAGRAPGATPAGRGAAREGLFKPPFPRQKPSPH